MKHLLQYIKGFSKNDPVPFTCPRCKKHSLTLDEKNFYEHDNSEKEHNEDWFEPDVHSEITYSAQYVCKTSYCSAIILSIGHGKVNLEYDDDVGYGYGNGNVVGYYKTYSPKYFSPTLNYFEIPDDTPDEVKNVLMVAFELVGVSYSSTINKIRIAIEVLMDEQGVPCDKTLGNRIKKLTQLKPETSSVEGHFNALRNLGNAGSHEYSNINIKDIEDAFEITEELLIALYKSNRLKGRIDAINQNKGPLTYNLRKALK